MKLWTSEQTARYMVIGLGLAGRLRRAGVARRSDAGCDGAPCPRPCRAPH